MCKISLIAIHGIAIVSLIGATGYIILNESGRLNKVKRECYNKMMDVKDEIRKKLK